MKGRKVILFIVLVLILFAVFCGWEVFGPTVQNPKKHFLYIKTGSTYADVKDSLLKNDMINRDFWFDQVSKYAGYPQKVKAGKYKVTKGMSLYHLIKMLRSGRQSPVNLVITKLRTKEDFAKKVSDNFEIDSSSALTFLNNDDLLNQYDVDSNTVMTDVIPNTYTYTWNTSMKNIFKKLYDEHQKFWNEERMKKAERLNLTPHRFIYFLPLWKKKPIRKKIKEKLQVYILTG